MSVVTPTRRAASRSAPSSATRSLKLVNDMPGAMPLIDDDIPIDPALLEEDVNLQEDMDAEGEVDDGVGYYLPVSLGPGSYPQC